MLSYNRTPNGFDARYFERLSSLAEGGAGG